MVILDVLLTRSALLLSFVINQGGSGKEKFDMGCECGLRKFDKESEADCMESAKLEDTQAWEASIIKSSLDSGFV